QNFISAKNLLITNDLKIKSVDQIDVSFLNNKSVLNNLNIIKNSNKYQIIGSQIDGERIIERILKNNTKNKISNFFKNLNTTLIFNIDKIFLEKDEYLRNFDGEFDIKNNKLIIGKANANLERENKFTYSYRTTAKNEKITNILIEEPKPFINNYKFIKGFEEGVLKLNSLKIDNTSRSNLKITNFKVKEVPVLAKILTLASLQGIADLLTGEGIRFDKFEMDFKTKNNLTEIDEMYAIGSAISIMMEGYIEKDRITSLRGTLVPATTINKTISKIPLLGNILVGSKAGEGVFGVSFKIKGPPNDLKSTVNPIKTLTPRFITRTLENLKG
ncbi:AsmA-like C-terminal region-containing protein, partial [Candidatus Pelagibacter sp.]|nr:AsmA-like C-terminal region-containing protein [Candidatus Pelagibacter sp.]